MRKLVFAAVVGASLLVVLMAGSLAVADSGKGKGGSSLRAHLTGYQETPSVSTQARGEFRGRINRQANTIDFTLTYAGVEGGTVSQAHIHFGERHTSGGISVWLCGPGTVPPTTCPATAGTVTGTIDANDVVGPGTQGIQPTEFVELLRAIRAGAAYANVHSTGGTPQYPAGEIRGQIRGGGRGGD